MGHLTYKDRQTIQQITEWYCTQKEIALTIGKSQQCISKELSRYAYGGQYHARYAQACAESKKGKGRYTKLTEALKEQLIYYLSLGWSPKMIVGRKHLSISFKTIYRWLDEGKLKVTKKVLVRKGKKPRKRVEKSSTRLGEERNSIDNRPQVVDERLEIGHWEADTTVSSHNTYSLVILVDRATRLVVSRIVPDRNASTVEKAIKKLLRKKDVKSITFDNGREFANYKQLEEYFGITTYFAHPYASWERGTNENTNRLLRRFFLRKQTSKQLHKNK